MLNGKSAIAEVRIGSALNLQASFAYLKHLLSNETDLEFEGPIPALSHTLLQYLLGS